MASSSSHQPNATLYVNNLNDKVNKLELKSQLYAVFATYGKVIDIIASKAPRMRGQAFLVFADLAGATAAMRACDGMPFYEKPMRITYAKTKSHATSIREDPNFVPPNAPNASALANQDKKRTRQEEPSSSTMPATKREKKAADSEDEMEIDEEEK